MNRTKLRAKRERKVDEFHDGRVQFPHELWAIGAGDGLTKTAQLEEIKRLDMELGDDGYGARFPRRGE